MARTTFKCGASLVGVIFKTSGYYFHRLHDFATYNHEQEPDTVLSREIEVDEIYSVKFLTLLYLATRTRLEFPTKFIWELLNCHQDIYRAPSNTSLHRV